MPVSVEIDSTEYVNIFFVPNREQYDIFLQRGNYQSTIEQKGTRSFSNRVVASKGQGIIIQSAGDKTAEINIQFAYT